MSQPLVECVPNFSEGRDKSVIGRITAPIEAIPGVTLLDVDMGADFNRTVVTMVGNPDDVLKAVDNTFNIGDVARRAVPRRCLEVKLYQPDGAR